MNEKFEPVSATARSETIQGSEKDLPEVLKNICNQAVYLHAVKVYIPPFTETETGPCNPNYMIKLTNKGDSTTTLKVVSIQESGEKIEEMEITLQPKETLTLRRSYEIYYKTSNNDYELFIKTE